MQLRFILTSAIQMQALLFAVIEKISRSKIKRVNNKTLQFLKVRNW